MESLVSTFNHDSDLNNFSLPFEEAVAGDHDAPLEDESHGESIDPGSGALGNGVSDPLPGTRKEPEAPKKPGISRSTYFRAKRNLKSHGSVRSAPSGKQIGRPQKLDANAERLIQNELDRNPAAELKQLQALVYNKCAITVSLSSISRRLKALGCSPSQNIGHVKRSASRRSDDAIDIHISSMTALDAGRLPQPQLQTRTDEFDPIPQLADYDSMHDAFATNLHDQGLSGYDGSPGMNLDMLDMQAEYANLGQHALGSEENSPHMYKYHAYDDKDQDLHDYSPGLHQDIYHQAEHQRQMLFNDPDLGVSNSWQEV